MPVLGPLSVTLEVPEVEVGIKFYNDAGLVASKSDTIARLRCEGQTDDCVVLLGGFAKKRLHHITLLADGLDEIAANVERAGGSVAESLQNTEPKTLWVRDPHGMLIQLLDAPAKKDLPAGPIYEINAPGRIVRKRRSAILPSCAYPPAKPLKLGHILLFTPDVAKSVEFVTEGLGMGLADRADEVIAFCCTKKDSDHHVVAFAKSSGVGFHHASFQVRDPDEVGRGGRALAVKSSRGNWGFGRHTIGSNFFHYIQDPWGSWFEYYSDMDYIDDYSQWTPTNYAMEDSLASWGPELPRDFVHNYEMDPDTVVPSDLQPESA